MILTDLIKEQALQSIIMFSAGLGLGMLYQVWGKKQGAKCKNWINVVKRKKQNRLPERIFRLFLLFLNLHFGLLRLFSYRNLCTMLHMVI